MFGAEAKPRSITGDLLMRISVFGRAEEKSIYVTVEVSVGRAKAFTPLEAASHCVPHHG
jgi:hypothetical protein